MTDEEIIAVVTAHKEGKTIEVSVNYADDWGITRSPMWDFEKYNYRIKPEPHYRPFESAEEVMEAIKEHGDWVKGIDKNYRGYHKILSVFNNSIDTQHDSPAYQHAFAMFTFCDGTPFGKLVEE